MAKKGVKKAILKAIFNKFEVLLPQIEVFQNRTFWREDPKAEILRREKRRLSFFKGKIIVKSTGNGSGLYLLIGAIISYKVSHHGCTFRIWKILPTIFHQMLQ